MGRAPWPFAIKDIKNSNETNLDKEVEIELKWEDEEKLEVKPEHLARQLFMTDLDTVKRRLTGTCQAVMAVPADFD